MSTTTGAVETTSTEPASQAVVEAVAAETGADPMTLEPLYDVLDPDALDALFDVSGMGGAPARVEFTYAGCAVAVTADGSVDAVSLDC